jgi:hypothetical protein
MSRGDRSFRLCCWHIHPGLLMFFRGAGIATILGVLVCAQMSCMIPQSVDPANATPHPPPLMLISQFNPNLLAPTLTLIRQGSADAAFSPPCHCELLFEGITVEADPDLQLEARWFVDYDDGVQSSHLIRILQKLDPLTDEPKSLTRTLQKFQFDANPGNGIVQSGVHILEVVVGESAGFDDSSSAPRPLRTMKQGYLSAEYRFALDVTLEQVPGQCPRTPPSTAICQ